MPRLDLGMAVGAQENALARLGAQFFETVCATSREAELFRSGIRVVELESRGAMVIAAQAASPASLLNENALDALSAFHYARRATSPTSVVATPFPHVLSCSMSRAHDDRSDGTIGARISDPWAG
jgi:hypothetical protein